MTKVKNKFLVFALTLVIALSVFAGLSFNKNSMQVYALSDNPTVGEVLATAEGGFPTTYETAWKNSYGSKMYYTNPNLMLFNNISYGVNSSTVLNKIDENTYSCNDSVYSAKWTFNMSDGMLSSVKISNGNFTPEQSVLKGTYTAPAPQVDDTFKADGINYVVTSVGDTNTVKVGNNQSFAGTSVTISATVTYKDVTFDVTEIGDEAFQYCINLKSITFEKNSQLTTIGVKAFYSTGITEIEIPAGVTSLSEKVFLGCYDLATVTMLATEVPTLGQDAFKSCSENLKIKVPASSLDNYKTAWSAYESKIEAIPAPQVDDTFKADGINYVVTSVGDTNTVKVGDNKSFAGNSVTIPATVTYKDVTFDVTEIGEEAFYRCGRLSSVIFESNSKIATIGRKAFGYTYITEIEIPASVVIIKDMAFESSNLSSVTFEDGSKLTTIGGDILCLTDITEITLPASVTTINDWAFDRCTELKTVKILAKEVPNLEGPSCFFDCDDLEKIYVPISSLESYKTASRWSDYADKIEAYYTIADILNTVDGSFPTTEATAWVNIAKNSKIFIKEGQLCVTNVVDILQQSDNVCSISEIVATNIDNDYIFDGGILKFKFVMDNSELSSIVISCDTIYPASYVLGTFAPHIALSSILPSNFPTTEATAWVNADGYQLYLDSDNLVIDTFTLPLATLLTKDGNNYKYEKTDITLPTKTWTFNMTSGVLTSISFNYAYSPNACGEYKAVTLITKPIADTTNFVYDGNAKTYQLATNDAYTISDNTTQTEIGTYTITVSLKNAQYKWADGTTEDLTYKFVINQKVETVKVTEDGVEIDKSQAKVSIIEAEDGIAPNAVFVVKTIPNTNTESINKTENVLRENNKLTNKEVFAVYDAKLLLNGDVEKEVQPNGTIKIKMLVPTDLQGKNFVLYHIHNGTEVEVVDYTAVDENGYITFETDKLSEFAFATDVESTGLSAGAIVGIVLGSLVFVVLVVYALGYFFLYRKCKLDDKKIKVIYKFLPKSNDNK